MYENGLGAQRDLAQAQYWYRRAAQFSPPWSLPAKSAFFRLSAIGRMLRSTVFESISMRPSSRNRISPSQRPMA